MSDQSITSTDTGSSGDSVGNPVLDGDTATSLDTQNNQIRASLLSYLNNNYYVLDVKNWEIQNERTRVNQAFYRYGEYAIFVIMWTRLDYEAGLVGRCQTCFNKVDPLIADTFQQSPYFNCGDCYGTTFEGGYKAILTQPSLWEWAEPVLELQAKGTVNTDTATIQTPGNFRLQPKDYIIRGDGTRWQVKSAIDAVHLITGFGTPSGGWNAVSYTYREVAREDESHVIYQLPISLAEIHQRIPQYYSRVPIDFTQPFLDRPSLLAAGSAEISMEIGSALSNTNASAPANITLMGDSNAS